jgi:hypothetical protein
MTSEHELYQLKLRIKQLENHSEKQDMLILSILEKLKELDTKSIL